MLAQALYTTKQILIFHIYNIVNQNQTFPSNTVDFHFHLAFGDGC